jgi:hypothetical protein
MSDENSAVKFHTLCMQHLTSNRSLAAMHDISMLAAQPCHHERCLCGGHFFAATTVLSEDMQDGMVIDGIVIKNPFRQFVSD